MSERSFRGRLLADHNGKLLDLQVSEDSHIDSPSAHSFLRLSPTSRKTTALAEVPRPSLVVRNRSRKCVCCSPFGKPWGLPFAAWTNCMSFLSLLMSGSPLKNCSTSDVYMDHINRKMAIDMLVRPHLLSSLLNHIWLILSKDDRCSALYWTTVHSYHSRKQDRHNHIAGCAGERAG